jgi:hypothetical protein
MTISVSMSMSSVHAQYHGKLKSDLKNLYFSNVRVHVHFCVHENEYENIQKTIFLLGIILLQNWVSPLSE